MAGERAPGADSVASQVTWLTKFAAKKRVQTQDEILPAIKRAKSVRQGKTTLNLATTLGRTIAIQIPRGITTFSAQILIASGKTWSSAVADLQFSIGTGRHESWVARTPAVQWTTSAQHVRNIAVVGLGLVRLATTVAEPLNDPAAIVVWSME